MEPQQQLQLQQQQQRRKESYSLKELMNHRRHVGGEGGGTKSVSIIRRFVHKVQKKFVKLVLFLIFLSCLLELASLVLYVYVEEYKIPWSTGTVGWLNWNQGSGFFTAQAVLSWVFTCQWIILLIGEQYRVSYLLSLPTFVNILTCFPLNIISIGALFDSSWTEVWVPVYMRVWRLYEMILLLLDYPQLAFLLSELTRETLRHVLFLVSTMITCIGTFHAVESFTNPDRILHLFESTYFIVVTFGTIGYGDIHPTTILSRMVTIVIIIVAVYQFPQFFSKLAELAKERPKFTTFSSRSGAEHHVIVAGSLYDRDVAFFLNEFFSGTRKFIRLKMVLLSTVEFSQETRLLVTSPGYSQRVTLVIGDASNRADLDRCDAAFADAIFHVNNGTLPSSLADYEIVMKSIAVHQYDSNLPQHVMLRRERNSKFICNVVSSIMEKERLQFTLLGLGCVLPGAIPLVVNFIRTYDPDDSTIKCRDWREQNEWSMGHEIYTFDPPPELVQKKRPFIYYTWIYAKHNVCVFGVVDTEEDSQIILNPTSRIIDSTDLKFLAIAPDKYTIEAGSRAVLRHPPQLVDMPVSFRTAFLIESELESRRRRRRRRSTRAGLSGGGEEPIDESPVVLDPGALDSAGVASPEAPLSTVHQSAREMSTSWINPPEAAELPDCLKDTEGTHVTFTADQAATQLVGLRNHIVLVDLISARVAPDLSPEAGHESAHFQGTDLFNLIRPIKLHDPSIEILLLTRNPLPSYLLKLWAQTGCRPVIVVTGCGLNMEELRSCQLAAAKSVVIFSTGEGFDENGDAMTLLVSFSIEEIVRETDPSLSLPVVISVDQIESLALFPPYYSDDQWTAEAEGNFALEPNMILGRAICSSMLDPALYQTYFSPNLLNAIDALIYGNGRTVPIHSMPMPPTCKIYGDVVRHCVSEGVVAIGLHRFIDDPSNEEIHYQRFMFASPPVNVPVLETDIIYFLVSSTLPSPDEQDMGTADSGAFRPEDSQQYSFP